MKGIQLVVAVLLIGLARPAAAAEQCGCGSAFQDLVAAVERSYAGFDVAVSPANRGAYVEHTSRLRDATLRAGAAECFGLLREWIDYFADGHLQVSAGPAAAVSKAPFERVRIDGLFGEQWEERQGRDPIEGIWQGPNGRIGVFRAPASMPYDFFAVALDGSRPQEAPLVATFEADEERRSYRASWRGEDGAPLSLEVSTGDGDRLYAGFWGFRRADDAREGDPLVPSFSLLDDQTALLRMPSMLPQYRAPLEALLREHRDVFARTPRLVLDLRGNMGGSDFTYDPLLPYIASGPIVTVAAGVLNSEDHVRYYERFIDRDNPENTMPWVTELLGKMAATPEGSLIPIDENVTALPELHPYPEKIAILVDGSNGSSAETFLLKALQSDRVTVLGRPTRGNVDYLNPNVIAIGCPADELRVSVPAIRRSLALPADAVNGRGIAPHVRIPDAVTDWVSFAARYLARDAGPDAGLGGTSGI